MTQSASSRSVAILGTRGYPSYYGGFETAVRKLAPYLADAGWDVTVYGRHGATRDDDPDLDPRVRRIVTRGANTRSLSTLSYGFWSAVHAVRARPDVVLVMNVANGYWLPLLRMRGIPTVVNVDGMEWERAKWGRLARVIFRWGARLTARFADRIVVDSIEIGRRWREDLRRTGEFIPYGGTVPPSLPVEPGLVAGTYALLVARFVPENTVGEFIEAASEISRNRDVVLVGSSGFGGELEEAAARLAEENPRVRWLGHVADDLRLLSLWQHAGAYFHGHSVGGTNPALVQAMACGCPIVARDTVFNREVLDNAAVFVEPDPRVISTAVSELIASGGRRRSLASAARARAESMYSWDVVCRRYEAELNAAVDG